MLFLEDDFCHEGLNLETCQMEPSITWNYGRDELICQRKLVAVKQYNKDRNWMLEVSFSFNLFHAWATVFTQQGMLLLSTIYNNRTNYINWLKCICTSHFPGWFKNRMMLSTSTNMRVDTDAWFVPTLHKSIWIGSKNMILSAG